MKLLAKTPDLGAQFDPHELTAERVAHLYRRRHSALVFNALSGTLIAGVLSTGIGWAAGIWLALFLAAHGWHWHMGRTKADQPGITVPIESIRSHLVAAALAGLAWGCAGLAIPALSSQYAPMLLVSIVLAAVIALPRMAAMPAVYGAYAAGAFLPLLAIAVVQSTLDRPMLVTLLAVVSSMLWASAHSVEADLMDVVLRRMALERMAGEDKLTGLKNRRRFDEIFEAEWRRAARMEVPISLMLLDVDHFKKYNDRYGHTAGDECLARVAAAVGGQIKRSGDLVARYGGEEFVILLFHTSVADARSKAEQIRRAVEEMRLPHQDSGLGTVTVSIGGATVVPTVNLTGKKLLDEADAALYEAKSDGRNRVSWNHSLLQVPQDI